MGRPKGSTNKKKALTQEHITRMVEGKRAAKENAVEIKSDSFTITCDSMQWTVEIGQRTLHFSRLDYLCLCLLSAKLKRAEVKSLEALQDEIRRSTREILSAVGKVYPPTFERDE